MRPERPWNGWLIASLGFVISTGIVARTWMSVRLHKDHAIDVTGSAKRRIVSDLIEWKATVTTENRDRTLGYKALHQHIDATIAYLKAQKVADAEVRVSSASAEEIFDVIHKGKGEDRIEEKVFKYWQTTQTVVVKSKDVPNVERVSREVTQLIEQGVPIESEDPKYFYSGLGVLKIEMLAEAAKDAQTRASRILAAAGGVGLGKLRRADMGVININKANSTDISSEGNNDTTTLEKDILTIVHCSYDLDR